MKRKRIILVVVALLLFALLLTWVSSNFTESPNVSLLKDPKQRRKILARLIADNNINDLPKNFSYSREGDLIRRFSAKDKDGHIFHVLRVTYDTDWAHGDRCYMFVFDSQGKCILKSRVNESFIDGGLFDFTSDGYVEKILVSFLAESDAGEIVGTYQYDSALQVWRLESPTPHILLDVRFKLFPGDEDDPNDFMHASVGFADRGAEHVELVGRGFKPRVSFSWSEWKKQFVCRGPLESKRWRVLFPMSN